MRKIYSIILLTLLLISSTYALDSALIKQKMTDASADVEKFFNNCPKEQIVIVIGSKISIEDQLIFNIIKKNLNSMQAISIVKDKDYIKKNTDHIVLVGSDRTNLISKNFVTKELNNRTKKDFSPLILDTSSVNGNKIMMLYSKKEVTNQVNSAAAKSPLNIIIDEKYVPAVATLLSLFLLYLWQILGKTSFDLISESVASKFLDNRASKKKIKKHEHINKYEILAFVIYVIIFAWTIAYGWSDNSTDFWYLFKLNLVIVGVISFVREGARLLFSNKHKFKSEFRLWRWGSIVTILSTFLGNTFSLVSYTLLDEDEKDEKRFGKYSYFLAILTFLFAIIAYIVNIVTPSVMWQMMFVFCMLIVFIEMFPMSPMPGYDIRKWNFPVWIISYVVVFLAYVYMNFTAYV
jgi:hypothetical protein